MRRTTTETTAATLNHPGRDAFLCRLGPGLPLWRLEFDPVQVGEGLGPCPAPAPTWRRHASASPTGLPRRSSSFGRPQRSPRPDYPSRRRTRPRPALHPARRRSRMRSEGRTRRPEPLNILGSGLAACALEVVSGLPVQPELRAVAEIEAKAQRRIDGVPPPGVGDFGNPVGRSADRVLSRYCGDPVLLARVPRSRRIRLATAETAPEAKEPPLPAGR
jgi:hypothetical protein